MDGMVIVLECMLLAKLSKKAELLVKTTYECLMLGIKAAKTWVIT